MIKEELVKVRYCDCCGEKIDEDKIEHTPFVVVHGVDGDVEFESSIVGDYCYKCLKALVCGWLASIDIIERYDDKDEKALKSEVELVKKHLSEVEDGEDDWM